MGVFHFLKIVPMVPNCATHHILVLHDRMRRKKNEESQYFQIAKVQPQGVV